MSNWEQYLTYIHEVALCLIKMFPRIGFDGPSASAHSQARVNYLAAPHIGIISQGDNTGISLPFPIGLINAPLSSTAV